MGNRCKAVGLAAGPIIAILIGAPVGAIAQAPPDQLPSLQPESQPAPPKPAPKPKSRARAQPTPRPTSEVQPDLDAGDQLAPSQMQQPMPAQAPMPGKPPKRAAAPAPATPAAEGGDSKSGQPPAASRKPGPGTRTIACSGTFARDSSHLKIAVAFNSKNVSFTDVDSGVGGKVQATVIYPSDPKRRLEVWWNNPANRSDTYLIIINGQSNWAAPKGVRLGLGLQALEKLNKKPFKLKGFSKDNVASVSDWQGGALAALPGGCKVGVNLALDAKAAAEVRSAVTGDKEFDSSDAAMRAAKPTVHEIIIGY